MCQADGASGKVSVCLPVLYSSHHIYKRLVYKGPMWLVLWSDLSSWFCFSSAVTPKNQVFGRRNTKDSLFFYGGETFTNTKYIIKHLHVSIVIYFILWIPIEDHIKTLTLSVFCVGGRHPRRTRWRSVSSRPSSYRVRESLPPCPSTTLTWQTRTNSDNWSRKKMTCKLYNKQLDSPTSEFFCIDPPSEKVKVNIWKMFSLNSVQKL